MSCKVTYHVAQYVKTLDPPLIPNFTCRFNLHIELQTSIQSLFVLLFAIPQRETNFHNLR